MKCIVLFGAGKSSSALITYLKSNAETHNWQVFVADANLASASGKTGNHALVKPIQIDVCDEAQRTSLIQKATVVISLLPPALHILVAKNCIAFGKHLLTASYIDNQIRLLAEEIKNKQLLFLCEMGLDPGIDHMSAMSMIHSIEEKGGIITSFKSHCGGLVAPESDDNPWHYKISWNPRNVVMAGKSGALYKEHNELIDTNYNAVFLRRQPYISIPQTGVYAWYPNRDSLTYMQLYGLQKANTFLRTTLRHPDFMTGWQTLVDRQLTDDTVVYNTDGITYAAFFKNCLTKIEPTETVSVSVQKQWHYLGMYDEVLINKGKCSAANVLQQLLEQKLAMRENDKDMVVMMHEIEYNLNDAAQKESSYLVVKGENNRQTAMAKTVGLPIGIAAKLLLEGSLLTRGLHIPISKDIYRPVLAELKQYDIAFLSA